MKYSYDKISKSLLIVLAEAGYSWHEVMKFPAMLNRTIQKMHLERDHEPFEFNREESEGIPHGKKKKIV